MLTALSLLVPAAVLAEGTIQGTPADDALTGTPAADSIFGLVGNDRINGDAGDDDLAGRSGVKQLSHGSLRDLGWGARYGRRDALAVSTSTVGVLEPGARHSTLCLPRLPLPIVNSSTRPIFCGV